MLKQATANSLVVLDEVGRGTSTYDGMSLAQAILEHFAKKIKPMTLFATHYHELVSLEESHPGGIVNRHMAIREEGSQMRFLYQLVAGPAGQSYGIQVADLAGLPRSVIQRAGSLLGQLEKQSQASPSRPQLDLFSALAEKSVEEPPECLQDLRDLEIHKMTPLDALNKISQWQRDLT